MTFSLRSRALAAIVSVCSIAVLATGCGTGNTGIDTSEASTNQMITANITEPSNGLLPGDPGGRDVSGWKIVSQLYDGLVTFDTKGNRGTRPSQIHHAQHRRVRIYSQLETVPQILQR